MSEQLALRLVRRRDHSSSHAAAARAVRSGLVAGHEARLLAALHAAGCALSLDDLADATGLDKVQCARRLSALVRRGLLHRLAVQGERLRWMVKR